MPALPSKLVADIAARVTPTICPTYSNGEDVGEQGRISRTDFDTLHVIAGANAQVLDVAIRALAFVAQHLTSDEGDEDETEDEFGLPTSEVVEMAHDNMITTARAAIEQLKAKGILK